MLAKVFARLNGLNIHTKLVLFTLLLVGIPFLVLGPYWYEKSTDTIESNAASASLQNIEQMNERLNAYFEDLEKATLPMLQVPIVQQFLKLEATDEYDLYVLGNRIEKEVFNNLTYGRDDVLGVSIVKDNGLIVTNYQKKQAQDAYDRYKNDRSESDDRQFKIEGVRRFDYNIPVLTLTRKVTDLAAGGLKAMIVLDLNFKSITDILERIRPSESGFLWLTGPDGHILFHPELEQGDTTAQSVSLDRFGEQRAGYRIESAGKEKNLIVYHHSDVTGLILIAEVPIRELTGNLIQLRNVTIVIGLLLIGLALTVFGGFTWSLSHSLSALKGLMKRAELGDLNVRAPEHATPEIRSLNNSFNKMVGEMKRLIDIVHISELKEKEMDLRHMESILHAMQSQINPHFLYNTLEMVNSFALKSGAEEVSQMIHSIARMFRYCIGNPQQVVKLEEEINHIAIYLSVQQERFEALRIEIALDEQVTKRVDTVRLCLQPILENCFTHGYDEHNIRPVYVGIFGMRRGDAYVVRIVDRGGGMPAGTRDRLNEAFHRTSVKQILRESKFQMKNIGMWNVHSRLRMTFGERYGLRIHASDAEGTSVDIVLPLSSAAADN